MSARVLLGVNIDHVATVRQARGTRYPDPVEAALVAEAAGADAITVHLREDRRHIQERDVRLLKEVLGTRMNLEMAVTDDMVALALRYQPEDCCLVPERREELTTEGGLDVAAQEPRLKRVCTKLAQAGIRVSLFIDPDPVQVRAAAAVGAPVIELHTGRYAESAGPGVRDEQTRLQTAATLAAGLGLRVHAGHGLHYHNTEAIARIPEIRELNIGHALVARAIVAGLGPAVVQMRRLIEHARSL